MKCKMFNSVKHGSFEVLYSYELKEKAAFDIIGPIRNNYIITAIDYFSRKAWAETIANKSEKMLKNF